MTKQKLWKLQLAAIVHYKESEDGTQKSSAEPLQVEAAKVDTKEPVGAAVAVEPIKPVLTAKKEDH